jgi:putative membrane protein
VRIIGLLFNLLVLILVVFVAFSFSALNSENVLVNYYFGSRELPLPVVILVAILFGALLGIAASLGLVFKSRHQASKLRKTLRKTEKEVVSLQSVAVKDNG